MNLRVFIVCAIAIAALAACKRDSGSAESDKPAPKVAAPVAAQGGPTVQELTAGMVEAVTQGKSQTPVALKFDLLQKPVQGQPLEVSIALISQVAASPAAIQVTGTEGLELAAGDNHIEFPSIEPAQVYKHSIKLTPRSDGVYLLSLSVSLTHDQLADTRIFSVPIIVAAAPLSPKT